MLGTYDFCGHYDWTFEWLRREGGEPLMRWYWEEAIGGDSQRHAAALIVEKGFAGMKEYWSHTLAEEAAGSVSGQVAGAKDVRQRKNWKCYGQSIDRYKRANQSDSKTTEKFP